MRNLSGLGGAAIMALIGGCGATPPKIKFSVPETHGSLPNGLQVVILPDDTRTIVTVDMRIDVGMSDDPPGQMGMAHLVEHLAYQKRPGGRNSPPLFASYREMASDFNGRTQLESTHYSAVAAPEHLEALVRLEASRLDGDCSTIPREEFEREREVVRNEMRLRTAGAARGVVATVISTIYGDTHPYNHAFTFDDAAFAAITFDQACAFLKTNYVPARATLLLGGRIDAAEAKRLLDTYFAPLPAAKVGELPGISFARAGLRATLTLPVDQPHAFVAWPLPPRSTLETSVLPVVFDAELTLLGEDSFVLGGYLAPVLVVEVSGSDDEAVEGKISKVVGHRRGSVAPDSTRQRGPSPADARLARR